MKRQNAILEPMILGCPLERSEWKWAEVDPMSIEDPRGCWEVAYWLIISLCIGVKAPWSIPSQIGPAGVVIPLHVRCLGHTCTIEGASCFDIPVGVIVAVKVVDVLVCGSWRIVSVIEEVLWVFHIIFNSLW